MSMSILNLILLLSLMSLAKLSVGEECNSQKDHTFSVSVRSHRNQTGHRLLTVGVNNSNPLTSDTMASKETDVVVVHVTSQCNGVRTVGMLTTAEAPPVFFRRDDYELFPQVGWYKLHLVGVTWHQAKRKCEEEGAHLIIINSEAELNVVKKLFSRRPAFQGVKWNSVVFVGLSDLVQEGHFVTVFGQPLNETGFTRWWTEANQPDNAPGEDDPDSDCMTLEAIGSYNDHACSSKLGFVCEQEL